MIEEEVNGIGFNWTTRRHRIPQVQSKVSKIRGTVPGRGLELICSGHAESFVNQVSHAEYV